MSKSLADVLVHVDQTLGDLAFQVPAGVPAPGRYEVVAAAEGNPSSARLLATLDVGRPER